MGEAAQLISPRREPIPSRHSGYRQRRVGTGREVRRIPLVTKSGGASNLSSGEKKVAERNTLEKKKKKKD